MVTCDMCQVNGKFYWPHMANATAHIPCIVTRQKKVKALADWLAFYGEPVTLPPTLPLSSLLSPSLSPLSSLLAFYGEPVSLLSPSSLSSLCLSMCLFDPCRVYVYLVRSSLVRNKRAFLLFS